MTYKRKSQEKSYQPSAEEVAMAIKAFKKNGGLVKKLPDERVIRNNNIDPMDPRNASPYERISGFVN